LGAKQRERGIVDGQNRSISRHSHETSRLLLDNSAEMSRLGGGRGG
jgi:hypothetical protein